MAQEGGKLTKAQVNALRRMERFGGNSLFNGRNRPALHRLYELGLAEFMGASDTGWRMHVRVCITPAGREALQQEEGK